VVHAVALGHVAPRDLVVFGGVNSAGDGGSVRVWDTGTGKPVLNQLADQHGRVMTLAMGRVGDQDVIVVAVYDDDGMMRIWDADSGRPLGRPLTIGSSPPLAVALGQVAGRDVIVSGSNDGTLLLWTQQPDRHGS
jgi:WD40 repeat protein